MLVRQSTCPTSIRATMPLPSSVILVYPFLCLPIPQHQLQPDWCWIFHRHCLIFVGRLSIFGHWQSISVWYHSSQNENSLWGLSLSHIILHFLRGSHSTDVKRWHCTISAQPSNMHNVLYMLVGNYVATFYSTLLFQFVFWFRFVLHRLQEAWSTVEHDGLIYAPLLLSPSSFSRKEQWAPTSVQRVTWQSASLKVVTAAVPTMINCCQMLASVSP